VRLGVVTTSFPAAADDPAGAWVAEQCRWLGAQGHEVEVVCAGDPARPAPGPVPVHRIASPLFSRGGAPDALDRRPVGGLIESGIFSAQLVAALVRRARRWDAAIAHWLLPSAVALRLAAPRLPLVAIAHSGDVHLARRLGVAAPLAAVLAGRRTRLVFVSRALKDSLAAATPAPLRAAIGQGLVQPMGLDVARFVAAAAVAPAGPPRVVFLGRLVPIKGADLLVAAAARLTRPAAVVIAGAGPEAASLRAAVAAAALPPGVGVELVGEVRGVERDRLLGGAAVVVLPSRVLSSGRSEGSPRVALEAMAAGAALVVSATGGLVDLPAAAVSRVPADDADGLAAAIDRLLADPAARAAQIEAGRRHAAAHDWSLVGPRLVPELDFAGA
jgi:glycosyltransferase involved in cell wall biosynthesis